MAPSYLGRVRSATPTGAGTLTGKGAHSIIREAPRARATAEPEVSAMRSREFALGSLLAILASSSAAAQQTILERQEAMFRRNVGTSEQQRAYFPPHKIVGNLYYVGTGSLASFLVATPAGHILINTNYEDAVPVLRRSVEDLGFRFEDIEIILGSHAHGDHMQGDALVKQLTGGSVMAMAEDVPLLERMRPGDKPHPIDRVLHDGDEVSLGGSTLVARLTPGHTPGCTTWTLTVEEGGESYDVVIIGSMGSNPGFQFVNNPTNPTIAEQYERGFAVLRSLSPDIPLASHPAMYGMVAKVARLGQTPNPFIDPAGYVAELDAVEGLFRDVLAEQRRAAAGGR
jgi:metallo-beta-lactamase class B